MEANVHPTQDELGVWLHLLLHAGNGPTLDSRTLSYIPESDN